VQSSYYQVNSHDPRRGSFTAFSSIPVTGNSQ
jgi:hypothetical protein